ncbi:hypothetical protein HK405_005819 [Cladochytrium tenue]|nr:hypothetical protein HK405_005819 [Cladochytrium tenue]
MAVPIAAAALLPPLSDDTGVIMLRARELIRLIPVDALEFRRAAPPFVVNLCEVETDSGAGTTSNTIGQNRWLPKAVDFVASDDQQASVKDAMSFVHGVASAGAQGDAFTSPTGDGKTAKCLDTRVCAHEPEPVEYRCAHPHCGKVITGKSNAKNHRRTHNSHSPTFKCQLYHKDFKLKTDVWRHMRGVHNHSRTLTRTLRNGLKTSLTLREDAEGSLQRF